MVDHEMYVSRHASREGRSVETAFLNWWYLLAWISSQWRYIKLVDHGNIFEKELNVSVEVQPYGCLGIRQLIV